MDNATHALVGAALAKAGLERHTPLATATLVLAANAPDVDILSYVGGPYYALAFRRGITHGVPATAVLPFAVAGAMLAWDRWVRRRTSPDAQPARAGPLLLLSALGLLTHPLLDWMNTYGMRWWVPLDGGWSYRDALFIVDPWLWLSLGAAVFLSRRWGRGGALSWAVAAVLATALLLVAPVPAPARVLWVAGVLVVAAAYAAGLPRDERRRRRAARTCAGAALLYVLVMVAADAGARRDVLAVAARSGLGDVRAVMVQPLPADPLSSEVVILTREGYVRGSHAWTRTPRLRLDPQAVTPLRSGAPGVPAETVDRAIALAVATRDARHYLTWSRFPYYRVAPEQGGWRVTVSDARYDGRETGSLSGLDVHVGEQGSR